MPYEPTPVFQALLPRLFTERLAALRRDAAMIASGLAGTRPPSFTLRKAPVARSSSPATVLATRAMRVTRVVRETADAVTLQLEPRDASTGTPIAFAPGQFLTVLVQIDGEKLRRAYSITSTARELPSVCITVKRVRGGRVSNHLNDRVSESDILDVLGPSGSFVAEPSPDTARHIVLIAGGSGITPMMSIARTVLSDEPGARVSLIFGNRGSADIIFATALEALAAKHPDRFALRHVLSDPPAQWNGGRGLLDRAVLDSQLDTLTAPHELRTAYFLCGPAPMMSEARAALLARGVPAGDIREERFGSPQLRANADAVPASQRVTFRVRGGTRTITTAPGQTILEAGLEAKLAMPFSCALGGCGACKVKVPVGRVAMLEPNCLTTDERAQGYVLACVSHATSPCEIEVPT